MSASHFVSKLATSLAVFALLVLGGGATAQTVMESPADASVFQGPGTQGVEAYVGPQDPVIFLICSANPSDWAGEVGDDLHMRDDQDMPKAGYLASFTFTYLTASTNIPGAGGGYGGQLPPPGTTIAAVVRFYHNDPMNSIVGGLIDSIVVDGLPTATTDTPDGLVTTWTHDVMNECIYLPEDVWMTVELILPQGTLGSLTGESSYLGLFPQYDPTPSLGTSELGNWLWSNTCTAGAKLVVDSGLDLNFNLTVRLFDDCSSAPPNSPPTCTIENVEISSTYEDCPPVAGSLVVTEDETITVEFVGSDADDGDTLDVAATGLPSGASFTAASDQPSPLSATFEWTPTAGDKAEAPYQIVVTYTDAGGETSSCTLDIPDINLRPTCDAGGDAQGEIVEACTSPDGALVTLTGTASDPDDLQENLLFHWDVSDLDVELDDTESATTSGIFPIGVTMVTLTVCDQRGGFCTSDVLVRVEDVTPPEVMVTTDCATLWPPRHDMRAVTIAVMATDACSDPDAVLPIAVTIRSDEPDNANGVGDGNTNGDVNGSDGYSAPVDITTAFTPDPDVPGLYIGTVELRAERDGTGDGRAYTIDIVATDSSGNVSPPSSCVIVVPHSQRKK